MDGKKGRRSKLPRLGDAGAMMKLVAGLGAGDGSTIDSPAMKRQMVADWCRLLGSQIDGSSAKIQKIAAVPQSPPAPAPEPGDGLAPRVRQTLQRLLAGDSEKQIARHLQVSPHTVHVYVKAIYRFFNVNSRGELLARFVAPPRHDSGTSPSIP
ncbi:MAG TPA: helix-turn-helix transcriptional regulator [Tepidisphaeraceae bacterium]|nr:helix-turn-helix transcriptional regulator [Tepidisphaeraceae bacterium]